MGNVCGILYAWITKFNSVVKSIFSFSLIGSLLYIYLFLAQCFAFFAADSFDVDMVVY